MRWLWGTLAGVVAATVLLLGAAWGYGWANRAGPHAYAPASAALQAEAADYLAASLPPMPEGWRWETFEPEPGVALRTGRIEPPGAKGTVLVVPGYTAPLDLYSEAVRAFVDAGYAVAGLEYRGQGLSHRDLLNPEMGHVASWSRLGADLAAYVAELQRTGGGRVFVYANSMGAHVALRAAGEATVDEGPDVAGYALVAPMVKIHTGGFPHRLARAITGFYGATGLDGEFAVGRGPFDPAAVDWTAGTPCNTNPRTAWRRDALFLRDPALRVAGTTNGWVSRTMASTDAITAPAHVARIDRPVVMFTAGREAFVSTPAAAAMCERLARCERQHYAQASHCLVEESEAVRDDVFARTVRFFDGL